MTNVVPASTCEFIALTIVSPMQFGDEKKDQDRACWFESKAIAALCDGTTSSPFAAEAADLVAKAASVVFMGPIGDRLRVLSDLLMSRRMEAMRSEVKPPPHLPPGLQQMLQQAARDARAQSHQTTLVAARLMLAEEMTIAEAVWCGDSAFLALSPDTGLLMSSLSYGHNAAAEMTEDGDRVGLMTFAPGDELVAKVLRDGAAKPRLLEKAGIPRRSAGSWLICKPLDRIPAPKKRTAARIDPMAMRLSAHDRLLVPKYLAGGTSDSRFQGYCRFPFSRMIRRLSAERPEAAKAAFNSRGSVTPVLPDHFYSGNWWHIQERFPPDTHFVLASDGFYGGFASPQDLWDWLRSNKASLGDPTRRDTLLAELHASLHSRGGDDDISFVWVFPARSAGTAVTEPPHDKEDAHVC